MRSTLLAVAALALIPLAGCVSKGEYTRQVQAADQLEQELRALQARYEGLQRESGSLKGELAGATQNRAELERTLRSRSEELTKNIGELRDRIAALEEENTRLMRDKEEKVKEVSSTYEQLLDKMKGEIAKGQVTISQLRGKLTVNMVEAILFDSGKAEVKPEGLTVLGKVIEILKTVKDKSIRIEGHTDNVKITKALASRYPTNWELSAARAINVARYLQAQGVDPGVLSAAAFGEFRPVADNGTPEGRATNRRIEIVLVPKE
jgi:chemotaxis protein MotB